LEKAADMTLFMAASRLLACSKIKLATGRKVDTYMDSGIPGLAGRPHPFGLFMKLVGKEDGRAEGDR